MHGDTTPWKIPQQISRTFYHPREVPRTIIPVRNHIVGLVYNYRNSLSEDFTGDAKTFYNDENCVISAEIIRTSAEKPVNVIDKANFGVKYII